MDDRTKFFIAFLVVVLTLSLTAGVAMAGEKGSPFKDLCLKMMGVTKKTVEKEVSTVGYTIKKSAGVVAEEVKDVGELATGKGSKVKDVLEKPVRGATAVAGEAAYGVLHGPIEAGQETFGGKDVK